MNDLDRFDRMLLAAATAVPDTAPSFVVRSACVDRQPLITSRRGPKYVDHTDCTICGSLKIGIEYHGELRSGAKVHTLAAHTAGMRRVERGKPRCLGAGMRLVFEGGDWRGGTP